MAADRLALRSQYVAVVISRDVMERHVVWNVASLRWLARPLLGHPCGLFSVEKFYAGLKSQGITIARDTLHQLVG